MKHAGKTNKEIMEQLGIKNKAQIQGQPKNVSVSTGEPRCYTRSNFSEDLFGHPLAIPRMESSRSVETFPLCNPMIQQVYLVSKKINMRLYDL